MHWPTGSLGPRAGPAVLTSSTLYPEDSLSRCCLSVCVPVTNINDGLMRAINMLNKAREEHRVPERSTSTVIMLTDGDANVGEAGRCGSPLLAFRPRSGRAARSRVALPMACEPFKGRALSPHAKDYPLPPHGLGATTPPALRV